MEFSLDASQQHIRFSLLITPSDISFLSRETFNKIMPSIREAIDAEGNVSEYREKELSKLVFAKVMLAVLEKEIKSLHNAKAEELIASRSCS